MDHLIIRGGTVVDGTGKPGYRGDVEVRGGIITAVGAVRADPGAKVLDAEGLIVAPGFIDAHAHSDTSFLLDGGASKLYQGITTEVSGNCGSSPFPAPKDRLEPDAWACASFSDFLGRFARGGWSMAVNQAMLTGHGSLREAVVGPEDRPATKEELEKMKALLQRDLSAGAWGLSLGLEYAPGFYAGPEELSFLAGAVRENDGIVTCHMRSEGLRIREAVEELRYIGRVSGARVHISHLKLDDFRVHGQAPAVWAMIEDARREGMRMTADMYPYTASCTALTIRCPKWSLDGGDEALLYHLEGPRRQEVIEGIRAHYFDARRAQTCLVSDDGGLWPGIVGKTLRQVAEEMLGTRDYAEAAAEVLVRTRAKTWCIFFVMDEGDMRYFLSRDVCIGSDSASLPVDPDKVPFKPHPRAYGAVAEFFRLAREERLCSVEEAVRRVTRSTARAFGIRDRGYLAPGKAADITVFDPLSIAPRAAYADPVRPAAGVAHVIVGGEIALENGAQTDRRAGRFLLRGRA